MEFVTRKSLIQFGLAILILVSAENLKAQSNDQNFPTPVTTNEIAGTIKARDIGDSRLTRYYFAFNGVQGDIFINVVTRNFTGDIDVYMRDGLRPLTKMVIYSDTGLNETGRLIYLRKPEKLLLRIEGRTPGDDPATFRIKFGGSFVALNSKASDGAETSPKTGSSDNGGVKVNSVGTIIDDAGKSPDKPQKPESARTGSEKAVNPEINTKRDNSKPEKAVESARAPTNPPAKKKASPMANVQLRIYFKDGKTIVYPMSEVVNFSVENGVLTITNTAGNIAHYSFPDVVRVAIQ